MNPSNHARSPLARLALAGGGVAALIVSAAAAHAVASLVGGARGTVAGICVVGAVFAACRLAFRDTRHPPRLTRPGPVRLPELARDTPEPASSLS